MSQIPIEKHGWNFYPETCPPDQDFIEYLEKDSKGRMVSVFHLGSGMHHKVGLWAATQKNIFVRAISITPEEIIEYIRLATENPILNSRYLVDFGDVHLLNPYLLPRFDYITLFHLGEISSQVYDPDYPSKSIPETVNLMMHKLCIGGQILFFENSVAWKTIKPLINLELDNNHLFVKSNYKSITIYRKTGV